MRFLARCDGPQRCCPLVRFLRLAVMDLHAARQPESVCRRAMLCCGNFRSEWLCITMPKLSAEITDKELEDIRLRSEAASPCPWVSFIEGRDHSSGSSFIMTGEGETRGADIELSGATTEDQDFIAHARQDVPRLLDEIERLRRTIAET